MERLMFRAVVQLKTIVQQNIIIIIIIILLLPRMVKKMNI